MLQLAQQKVLIAGSFRGFLSPRANMRKRILLVIELLPGRRGSGGRRAARSPHNRGGGGGCGGVVEEIYR